MTKSLKKYIFLKKVNVAGVDFDVVFPYLFKERDDIFGRIDFATRKIRITNITSNGQTCNISHSWQVFWHEVIHAIDHYYCLNKIGEEISKEEMIEALANGVVQVLKDNFGLDEASIHQLTRKEGEKTSCKNK